MPLTHRTGRVDGWRGRSPVRCCTSGTLARGCCRSESRPLPRANRRFAPAASWLYSVRSQDGAGRHGRGHRTSTVMEREGALVRVVRESPRRLPLLRAWWLGGALI